MFTMPDNQVAARKSQFANSTTGVRSGRGSEKAGKAPVPFVSVRRRTRGSELPVGGTRLKRVRLDCGLTYRDVERLSRVLADRYCDDRHIVRISVLARTENQGVIPNMFRLHSLCVIYSVTMRSVLSWFGLPNEPSRRTASRWLSSAAGRARPDSEPEP
jgi:transcriptional regulator with XRE-family HTH domain